MTVEELIEMLQAIEDKSLKVIVSGPNEMVSDVFMTERYFGDVENGHYIAKTRECVILYH